MSLAVRLRRIAQSEYDDAADSYEARRKGLGIRFVTAIREVLDDISAQPDRYPEVWSGVREAMLSTWPYAIYYQIHLDHIMVIAVFHMSRNPSVWQSRAIP